MERRVEPRKYIETAARIVHLGGKSPSFIADGEGTLSLEDRGGSRTARAFLIFFQTVNSKRRSTWWTLRNKRGALSVWLTMC